MTPASHPTAQGPCPERVEALSRLLDGELSPQERAALEAHLEQCPGCAAELEALRRMTSALQGLGSIDPPPELFESVATAVDRHRRRNLWAASVALLLVGAATLAAVAISRGPLSTPVAPRVVAPLSVRAAAEEEFQKAETHYRNAVTMLRTLAEAEKPQWSWKRRQAYDADLRVLESAIRESRKLVQTAPTDPALQELVFASYRAQIDYLRDVLSPRSDESI